jgi:hypothetical protein
VNQLIIHFSLCIAYFLIPTIVILSGYLESLQNIPLNHEVTNQIPYYLTTSFISIIIFALIAKKGIGNKIDWAKSSLANIDIPYINQALWFCITALLIYSIKIGASIDADMTRDDRFAILESSAGPLFMLCVKTGAFLSAISIAKGNRKIVVIFLFFIAFVTFITLSRSLLAIVIISFLPLVKIKKLIAFALLLIIFSSRLIFTSNFDISLEWLFTFGFGEMIGVTFGPYALLAKEHYIDLYEHISLMANVIPGLSLASRFGGYPEMTIFVNNIVKDEYGLYGVAGTVYIDYLVSKPVFLLCLGMLIIIYLTVHTLPKKSFYAIVIFSIYYASCLSILLIYRWSLSGYIYSITRDAILFTSVIIFLQNTKYLSTRNGKTS